MNCEQIIYEVEYNNKVHKINVPPESDVTLWIPKKHQKIFKILSKKVCGEKLKWEFVKGYEPEDICELSLSDEMNLKCPKCKITVKCLDMYSLEKYLNGLD